MCVYVCVCACVIADLGRQCDKEEDQHPLVLCMRQLLDWPDPPADFDGGNLVAMFSDSALASDQAPIKIRQI